MSKLFNNPKIVEKIPEYEYDFAETKMLTNELNRIKLNSTADGIDLHRYELQIPPRSLSGDPTAWNKSLDNLMTQSVHQIIRKMNLSVNEQHGSEQWKRYCAVLDAIKKTYQDKLRETQKEIQNINWKRKSMQEEAGIEIRSLENQWAQETMLNFELQMEISAMKDKLQQYNKN